MSAPVFSYHGIAPRGLTDIRVQTDGVNRDGSAWGCTITHHHGWLVMVTGNSGEEEILIIVDPYMKAHTMVTVIQSRCTCFSRVRQVFCDPEESRVERAINYCVSALYADNAPLIPDVEVLD